SGVAVAGGEERLPQFTPRRLEHAELKEVRSSSPMFERNLTRREERGCARQARAWGDRVLRDGGRSIEPAQALSARDDRGAIVGSVASEEKRDCVDIDQVPCGLVHQTAEQLAPVRRDECQRRLMTCLDVGPASPDIARRYSW